MNGISTKSPIYLVSQCYWEAIVVDESCIALALTLTDYIDVASDEEFLIIGIGHYRRQALGLILGSPPILYKIGELYHRCFSVVLEHRLVII